jgi:uncharacterized membrane protein YsdA (DUF1294 family)
VLKVALIGLALVNLITYWIYWLDKSRAKKGGRRISERELLVWAAVGGTPAAILAMRKFRHKTKKVSFRIWFWSVVIGQIALIVILLRVEATGGN